MSHHEKGMKGGAMKGGDKKAAAKPTTKKK
jgi:hypothetical protein